MATAAPPRAAHLINGDSAAGSLRVSQRAQGSIVVSKDPLSVGPLRAADNYQAWCETRREFWRDTYSIGGLTFDDPGMDSSTITDVAALGRETAIVISRGPVGAHRFPRESAPGSLPCNGGKLEMNVLHHERAPRFDWV